MVQQVPFPDSIAELDLLEGVTYRDAFTTQISEQRTAEEWMRRVLDRAPTALMSSVRVAQRALGLKLAEPSYEHPLGWNILRSEPDLFVLGAEGPGGSARLAGAVEDGRLIFTTQASFGLRTRILWLPVQFAHRAIARYLMRTAADPGA